MEKNIILGSLFVTIVLAFFVSTKSSDDRPVVTIGSREFQAIVSDTDALREQGLSGRNGLKSDEVMLFIFDEPSMAGFWMKDMKFPIDILWLDSDYRVVSFRENISPETYPELFYPIEPSKYVIELNAGTLAQLSLNVGDQVYVSSGK